MGHGFRNKIWGFIFKADSAVTLWDYVSKLWPFFSWVPVMVGGWIEGVSWTIVGVAAFATTAIAIVLRDRKKFLAIPAQEVGHDSSNRLGSASAADLGRIVRESLDSFGLASKLVTDPKMDFAIEFTMGDRIYRIFRMPQQNRYLQVMYVHKFPQGYMDRIMTITPEGHRQISLLMGVELSKAKVGYKFDLYNGFEIMKRIPITKELSEPDIIQVIDEVGFTASAALMVLEFSINDARLQATPDRESEKKV